jgi:hypothetical protein
MQINEYYRRILLVLAFSLVVVFGRGIMTVTKASEFNPQAAVDTPH